MEIEQRERDLHTATKALLAQPGMGLEFSAPLLAG